MYVYYICMYIIYVLYIYIYNGCMYICIYVHMYIQVCRHVPGPSVRGGEAPGLVQRLHPQEGGPGSPADLPQVPAHDGELPRPHRLAPE